MVANKPLLSELCREKRDKSDSSNHKLAEETGIPVSTINKFFSTASKSPSIYTAGPICAALGISLDEYFNISADETPFKDMEKKYLNAFTEWAHGQEVLRLHKIELKRLRIFSGCLLALCILMAAAGLAYLIVFDLSNPNYGMFQKMLSSL